MYKNTVYRYRVPYTIVSDNDKQFDYNKFKEFCDNLQIKKVFSSVVQPQANGHVEAINKMIKHNLKMKLEDLKGQWADELGKVLWVYKTTTITSTGETFFSLSYGYEVMILVEVGARPLRRENYDSNWNLVV